MSDTSNPSYLQALFIFYQKINRILFQKGAVNLHRVWLDALRDIPTKHWFRGLFATLLVNPIFTGLLLVVYLIAPVVVMVGHVVRKVRP